MHVGIFVFFISCTSESPDFGDGVSLHAPEVLFYTTTGEDCCGEDPHPVHGVETSDGGFVVCGKSVDAQGNIIVV